MSVIRFSRKQIEKVASTITILAPEQVRNLITGAECMKYVVEYHPTNAFDYCICRLFHYANCGNSFAYAMQYNDVPDCFPTGFTTHGLNDIESIEDAVMKGIIYATLNEAQDELGSICYNLYTNDGNTFMPEGLCDLVNELNNLLGKIAPHIQTQQEIDIDNAYAQAYRD